MVDSRSREQYTDALSVYPNGQEVAGPDIRAGGDAHAECLAADERYSRLKTE